MQGFSIETCKALDAPHIVIIFEGGKNHIFNVFISSSHEVIKLRCNSSNVRTLKIN